MSNFFRGIEDRIGSLQTRLCVGIDPPLPTGFPGLESSWLRSTYDKDPIEFTASFSRAAIDAASKATSVKFQSAYFEALGSSGLEILKDAIQVAAEKGIPTILDAKRGDISTTMRAYGVMAFDVLQADCLTITPYMGVDVIEPLLPWLKDGKAVYIVWVTSNPSANHTQFCDLKNGSPYFEYMMDEFESFATRNQVENQIGYVLGATKLLEFDQAQLDRIARRNFLMPGIGPQGGVVNEVISDLLQSSVRSIVPMSRGVTGIGDRSEVEALSQIGSWDQYRGYLTEKTDRLTNQV